MNYSFWYRPFKIFCAMIAMVAVSGAAGPIEAVSSADRVFSPHKATYQMQMVTSRSARNIASVDGVIAFEWADSCEAWTTNQRFEMTYQYNEGTPEKFISDYSSWEAKDGKSFSFTAKESSDTSAVAVTRGSVERTRDGANVEYSRPEIRMLKLASGFTFPSQHTFEVLRRAKAGEKFYSTQLFDGTDDKGSVLVTAFISDRLPAVEAAQQPNPLLRGPGYKVRMAFFDNIDSGDPVETASPGYEMTMELLENGIVRKIHIDYREFSIEGGVKTLDTIAPPNC
jgi:hypothetical protein